MENGGRCRTTTTSRISLSTGGESKRGRLVLSFRRRRRRPRRETPFGKDEKTASEEIERKRNRRRNRLCRRRHEPCFEQRHGRDEVESADRGNQRAVSRELSPRRPLGVSAEEKQDAEPIVQRRCGKKCHRRRDPGRGDVG